MKKAVVAAVLGVGAIAVGVGAGLSNSAIPPVTTASATHHAASSTGEIRVHVAGWVSAPGVVTVPDGSLVAEAIGAAGGLRFGAQVDALNLAAELRQGDQVVVPGPGPMDGQQGNAGDGVISINRATATELEGLPGVGPVLAERIVAHREEHGLFAEIEDLLDVAGIGEAKLASLREHVRP